VNPRHHPHHRNLVDAPAKALRTDRELLEDLEGRLVRVETKLSKVMEHIGMQTRPVVTESNGLAVHSNGGAAAG
jgi:hypothetical protein